MRLRWEEARRPFYYYGMQYLTFEKREHGLFSRLGRQARAQ